MPHPCAFGSVWSGSARNTTPSSFSRSRHAAPSSPASRLKAARLSAGDEVTAGSRVETAVTTSAPAPFGCARFDPSGDAHANESHDTRDERAIRVKRFRTAARQMQHTRATRANNDHRVAAKGGQRAQAERVN